MYCVYILFSEKDNKRYIGSTNNLDRRLLEHAKGFVRSTKNRRPLKLIYFEKFKFGKESRIREHYLKTHKGYNELEKILNNHGV